jgi:hypothetical protein
VLLLTALVFVLVLAGLLAVIANVLVLVDASAQVRSAAYVGAVAGGQDVSPGDVSGALTSSGPLSPAAPRTCEQQAALAAPSGAKAACSVTGNVVSATVCVSVQYPVGLLGPGGRVCDTERAGAAYGTVKPNG